MSELVKKLDTASVDCENGRHNQCNYFTHLFDNAAREIERLSTREKKLTSALREAVENLEAWMKCVDEGDYAGPCRDDWDLLDDLRALLSAQTSRVKMKDFDKEWCETMAELEGGQEVGAGLIGAEQPIVKLRLGLTAAQKEVERLQALLDAEMQSNKQLIERELKLSTENSLLQDVAKAARTVVDYRDSGTPRDLKTLEAALNAVSGRQS